MATTAATPMPTMVSPRKVPASATPFRSCGPLAGEPARDVVVPGVDGRLQGVGEQPADARERRRGSPPRQPGRSPRRRDETWWTWAWRWTRPHLCPSPPGSCLYRLSAARVSVRTEQRNPTTGEAGGLETQPLHHLPGQRPGGARVLQGRVRRRAQRQHVRRLRQRLRRRRRQDHARPAREPQRVHPDGRRQPSRPGLLRRQQLLGQPQRRRRRRPPRLLGQALRRRHRHGRAGEADVGRRVRHVRGQVRRDLDGQHRGSSRSSPTRSSRPATSSSSTTADAAHTTSTAWRKRARGNESRSRVPAQSPTRTPGSSTSATTSDADGTSRREGEPGQAHQHAREEEDRERRAHLRRAAVLEQQRHRAVRRWRSRCRRRHRRTPRRTACRG